MPNMKYLILPLCLLGAIHAFGQTAASETPTATVAPVAMYGTAKTTNAILGRGKRHLVLDDGVKRKQRSAFFENGKGYPVTFDSEAAVLNFLDSQGWVVSPNGQEPAADGSTYTLYLLKRKPEASGKE